MDIPRIISVDDHVLEPPDLWHRSSPAVPRAAPPGSSASRAASSRARGGWVETDDGGWADIWRFEGYELAIIPGFAAAGMDQNYLGLHWVR